MMMSMFSSSDALYAEMSGFSFSKPNASGISSDSVRPVNKDTESENTKSQIRDKTPSPPPPPPPPQPAAKVVTAQRKPQRTPRFALELDGVHCFETIVPY
ncbi:hypothetical protein TIFTF001_013517 [Ficus carica]|uniref:Uncharacterized protein n=1 Tax=Ficus carica TaxID=3494 RepID=A0AA87ZV25_FICCA|nr:hypothetical protein TIFTF001_013517 [Ficus carica]